MKGLKIIALGAAAALGMAAASASAQERSAGFTSHHLVTGEDYAGYARQLPAGAKLELRKYMNYEADREPCQGYRPPPAGFTEDVNACQLDAIRRQQRVAVVAVSERQEPVELRPVVQDYEVYFDFDKTDVRQSEQETLRRISQDIDRINPAQVTIVGHADRSGPADYNVALSKERALSVSQALSQRGIPNQVINQYAAGEGNPAVLTDDGVPLEENRRVEIQLRR